MVFMIPRPSNYTHNGQILYLEEDLNGGGSIRPRVASEDVLYAKIVEKLIDLS